MKRVISLLLSLAMVFSIATTSIASTGDDGKHCIEYVQTHNIGSREDFLSYVGDDELSNAYRDCEEVSFSTVTVLWAYT